MDDRQLLELVAKAAELGSYVGMCGDYAIPENWNPLTDDGDALRLAVKLQLLGLNRNRFADSFANDYSKGTQPDDPYAATRRAIVLAAAEIGKGLCHD